MKVFNYLKNTFLKIMYFVLVMQAKAGGKFFLLKSYFGQLNRTGNLAHQGRILLCISACPQKDNVGFQKKNPGFACIIRAKYIFFRDVFFHNYLKPSWTEVPSFWKLSPPVNLFMILTCCNSYRSEYWSYAWLSVSVNWFDFKSFSLGTMMIVSIT